MAIPWPKILTRITVPTGGWTFKFYASVVAQYDTACECTVAAGNYYISGDNQDDDLLWELQTKATVEMVAEGLAAGWLCADITEQHDANKVRLGFENADFADAAGDNDVKVAWTECSADLVAALGFDATTDDTSTATDYPRFTADWHHGFGWYASRDGEYQQDSEVDTNTAHVISARTPGGYYAAQIYGETFDNNLALQFIRANRMLSDGKDYGDAPVYPWKRNYGLECWWREARKGVPFRVYRDSYINTDRAAWYGTATAAGLTTLTDAGSGWETEPQRYTGGILYRKEWGDDGATKMWQSFFIESHTPEVITVPQIHGSGQNLDTGTDATYYLFDHRYGTYVLNPRMKKFDPKEHSSINEYGIDLPLMRFIG